MQKSFKLGCLSPCQTKHGVKINEEIVIAQMVFIDKGLEADMEVRPVTLVTEEEEENKDFFVEIYSKDRKDLECSTMEWVEGYSSSSCADDGKTLTSSEIEGDDDNDHEKEIQRTSFESF
ncbi:hypothetical protein L2E82_50108 [Cichorium intybus]|nr:hypothetical protein L2E82_50108 [Cichorium intybus]